MINLNNVDIFSHEALDRYSVEMTKTSLSFYAHWSAIVDTYELRELLPRGDISLHNFFVNKRAKFQEAWVNYIMLQHPDYIQQGIPLPVPRCGLLSRACSRRDYAGASK
ncbi:hypothetical protein Vafri_22210, partial [Volvox africanus]